MPKRSTNNSFHNTDIIPYSRKIHELDLIFKFLEENNLSREKAIEHYFKTGLQSATELRTILSSILKLNIDGCRLLEFASGYGCVTRHLTSIMPQCKITACDIHQEAVDFTNNILNCKAIISSDDPAAFNTPQRYDVAFALSFFSHMPKHTWNDWITALGNQVKPFGYLIFTTHGDTSLKVLEHDNIKYDEEGFGFKALSEQKDLDSESYGTTIVRPRFVIDSITNNNELTLKSFINGFWWGHQDLYIFQKNASSLLISENCVWSDNEFEIYWAKEENILIYKVAIDLLVKNTIFLHVYPSEQTVTNDSGFENLDFFPQFQRESDYKYHLIDLPDFKINHIVTGGYLLKDDGNVKILWKTPELV